MTRTESADPMPEVTEPARLEPVPWLGSPDPDVPVEPEPLIPPLAPPVEPLAPPLAPPEPLAPPDVPDDPPDEPDAPLDPLPLVSPLVLPGVRSPARRAVSLGSPPPGMMRISALLSCVRLPCRSKSLLYLFFHSVRSCWIFWSS